VTQINELWGPPKVAIFFQFFCLAFFCDGCQGIIDLAPSQNKMEQKAFLTVPK
jgi:hypothetical protein